MSSEIKAISLDCAGTIIDVNWNPAKIAVDAAIQAGYELDQQVAHETYQRMLHSSWSHFQQLNLQRSREVCDEYWKDLAARWLQALNLKDDNFDLLIQKADDACFGPDQKVFTLYPDVIPNLERLKNQGFKLVALSNWDVSLHRVLEMLKISHFFDQTVASLEEGFEKPDPRIFEHVTSFLDLPSDQILHVGDDPIADVQGALQAGFKAQLIDRSPHSTNKAAITSLSQIMPS